MIKPSVEKNCNTHPCEIVKCTRPKNCGYYNSDIPCSYCSKTSCSWSDGEGGSGTESRRTYMWNNRTVCISDDEYRDTCYNIITLGYRYRSGELIDSYKQNSINPGYCSGSTRIYCIIQTPV